jgi:hypothetical protein
VENIVFGIYQGDLSPLYSMGALPYDAQAVAEVMPDSLDDECAAEICYDCFCMEQGFHAYATNAHDLRRFCKDYWCVACSVLPCESLGWNGSLECPVRVPAYFSATPSCCMLRGSSAQAGSHSRRCACS